jgi:NMT1-like family
VRELNAALKGQVRLPTRLTRVSWRDLAIVGAPILLIVVVAFAIAGRFIRPAPPTRLVMTAGTEGTSFRIYAERYGKILARNGITLEILSSSGSVENLKRLSDPKQRVDVGFVQGGLPPELRSDELVSLGSVFYEPLFVLYRNATPIDRLSQLAGKRLAIGGEGSGGEALALALLKANGIEPGGATALLPLSGEAALKAMLERRADAVFLAGDSARPDEIRQLLHTQGLHLFDFVQADGYLRRFRYLSRIDLPMGVLDLGRNLPEHPAALVAPTVELVARSDLHPALADLLIEAAREVHGHGSVLTRAGEFPSPVERDFPVSDEAARYYKSGKSFAYRYLPFWLANLVERMLVLLVPTVVLLLPALRFLPSMYRWRIRARIFRPYGQLMTLERESQRLTSPEEARSMLERVDTIERAVINLRLPGQFADEAYILRQHIGFVRARLASIAAPEATEKKSDQ